MRHIRIFLVFGLLLAVVGGVWGQTDTISMFRESIGSRPYVTPAQDSLLQYLMQNKTGLKTAMQVFNWKQLLLSFGGLLIFVGAAWKFWVQDWLKKYIKSKAEEAVEEMAGLKGVKILVLSNGDDGVFLKSFFKTKGFSNFKFIQIADKKVEVTDFDYDVVFANNDNGNLDKTLARQYVKEDSVLFYFGKPNSWDWQNDTPELSRKINFANSRAQIYGNLMSSLEFLELVKPKIKNV